VFRTEFIKSKLGEDPSMGQMWIPCAGHCVLSYSVVNSQEGDTSSFYHRKWGKPRTSPTAFIFIFGRARRIVYSIHILLARS
jgi:hypothetical protein